jgi:hypothetical protein
MEERVSTFAHRVVTLLADGVKADLNREAADTMVSMMDQEIDREFVERIFKKFRMILNGAEREDQEPAVLVLD